MKTVSQKKPLRKFAAPDLPPGCVRLLYPICRDTGEGAITINNVSYLVSVHGYGYRVCLPCAGGKNKVYDLPADLSSCDCHDAIYRCRPRGCKHRRALVALRKAKKLPWVNVDAEE